MTEQRKLRWGIIGIGAIVNDRIAPAMVTEENCDLVAAVSRDQGRADVFAEKFGVDAAYDTYDAMLADPNVDAVFIATPNSLHASQVVEAANAGKAILCDKPLGLNTTEARTAVRSADAAEVPLGVNFHYRHMPWVKDVANAVRRGQVGTVKAVHLEIAPGPRRYENWRKDPEIAGMGSVFNVGVHGLDFLRVILDAEPTEVVAMFDNDPKSGSVEWLAMITIRFSNGTLVHYNANESLANPRNEMTVYGSDGRMVGEGITRSRVGGVIRWTTGDTESSDDYPPINAHRAALAAFTDSVLDGRTPNASGVDGLRNVALTDAIKRSVEERRIVEVDYR